MDERRFANSQEFTTFVLAVIRQKAARFGQIIKGGEGTDFIDEDVNNAKLNKHRIYDAIAPIGFENIEQPVVFEFKYTTRTTLSLQNLINQYKDILNNNSCFILITNSTLDHNTKLSEEEHKKLIVWDRDTVDRWIAEFPVDYNNAISLKGIKETDLTLIIDDEDFHIKSENNLLVVKKTIDENESFALVLGAGVSCDLGAKDWNSLLNYLKDKLLKEQSILSPDDVCKRIGDTLLITAELCKDIYKSDIDFYWDIHNGIYSNSQPDRNRHEIDSIVDIILRCQKGKNFRILTYNYDDFLEKRLDRINVPYSVIYNQYCMPRRGIPIYHAHGFFPQVKKKADMQEEHYKSIVLTESNYNELYNHPYDWAISCQLSFFRENTCLFIGSSLSDPNIRRLLQITKSDIKVHYAIMAKNETASKDLSVISNHFLKMGVEIIWVDDYPDILDILDRLLV